METNFLDVQYFYLFGRSSSIGFLTLPLGISQRGDVLLLFGSVCLRTTNHGHEMGRNYKIYSGTCVYASRGTCHGMHASGMSISAARGGAAGGSRDMNTERDPQELDTSWQQLAQDSGS